MNTQTDRARGLFACLGDASRYRIVATLSSGERCVTELARDVALSQSCTTRHLQALQRVGLVSRERQGKRVVFRLRTDDERVGGLLDWIRRESLEDAAGRRLESSAPASGTSRPQGSDASRAEGTVPSRRESSRASGVVGPDPDSELVVQRGSDPIRSVRRSEELEDYLL